MNTLLDTLQYFVFITIELIALFMLISAAVEIILMYIPEETIRKKLSGSGIMGNVNSCRIWGINPFLRLLYHSYDSRFSKCRSSIWFYNVLSDSFSITQSYHYRYVGSFGRI